SSVSRGRPRRADAPTEGKAREPQRRTRSRLRRPVEDRERILQLAHPTAIAARARTDAAEIEAQRGEPEAAQTARERVRHLVLHRAAVQWMRMTDDDEARTRRPSRGRFEQRFEGARRA